MANTDLHSMQRGKNITVNCSFDYVHAVTLTFDFLTL